MSQEVCPLRATTKNTPSRRGSRLWHFFSPHFFSFFFFYQRKILVAFLSASAANLSTFQQCCISQCVIPTMHCVVEFKKKNKKKKLHKTPVLKSNEIHSNGKHTRKFDCFFFLQAAQLLMKYLQLRPLVVASGITHISTMTPPHSSLRTKKDHLKANRLRLAAVFFLFFFYLPVTTYSRQC